MDKRLQKAIDKANQEKEKQKQIELDKAQDQAKRYEAYIKSELPKARKWIKDKLWNKISEIEMSGRNYLYLGSDKIDGVSVDAICKEVKKIKGLKITSQSSCIYENAECVGVGEPEYSIEWEK